MSILLSAFALLQFADILTTVRVLDKGGKEANPALAWLMARIGVVRTLVLAKVAIIALILWMGLSYPDELLVMIAVAVFDVVFVWVVWHNWRVGSGMGS